MPEAPKCPHCGSPLPSEGWEGLCPNCVVRVSLETPARSDAGLGLSALPSPVPLAEPMGEGAGARAAREAERASDAESPALNPKPGPGRIHYFGDYELLEEIARGGMGVVYKARQVSLNRLVAVKMILSGEFASEEFVCRFRAEAEAAANLHHPNIVAIHEVGVHEGQHYFSMDYVEGKNLAQLISDFGFRISDFRRAAGWLKTIAGAIHYAHERGILHRDLKPSNVLIDANDEPRITDFGLAKRLVNPEPGTRNPELTLTGQVLGSPSYMPPEQAEGKHRQVTLASDIYSLGAILYHLLTARPPFVAETLADTLRQLLHSEPPSPRLLNPGVPRDLETICLRCLNKEPYRRYASVQELADELGRFLRDEPIRARPIGTAARMWRWCRRNPVVASLAAMSLLLIIAVAIGSPIAAFRINRERQRADRNARDEARQRAQAEEMVTRLEIQNAELLFAADGASAALAYLARVLRLHPTNRVAAERLMAALGQRSFLVPATVPLRHNGEVLSAQFSPDGQQLVTVSHDAIYTARTWDVRSGQRLLEFQLGGAGSCAEFSPDGQKIATGDGKGNVQLWDALTGRRLGEALKHSASVNSVQFSPDGQRIVTASGRTAQVWDVLTAQLMTQTQPHSAEITSARFSPDGELIVTVSSDSTAQIWNAVTGQHVGAPFKNFKRLRTAQFSPDGRRMLTAGHSSVRIFDVRSGKLLTETAQQYDEVFSAQFSPDGQQILTTHYDKSVRLWDSYTGRPVTEPIFSDYWPHPAQFSQDGQRIITLSGHVAQIWYLPLAQSLAVSLQHEAGVGFATFSPDGQRLLTVTDGSAQVWDIRTGQRVSGPFRHLRSGLAAAFSPDGHWVVTGSWDHTARVWDVRTGEPLIEPIKHKKGINAVQFSPDGQRFLTSSYDGTARISDARTGQPLVEFKHDNQVHQARFSRDGKKVVTASLDKTARVWDAQSGAALLTLKHEESVWRAEFSPDGQRVVTASSDKAAHIWDAGTGKELTKPLRHHSGVTVARFSPNGDTVLTASEDNTARVWDAKTGEPLTEPLRHFGYVSAQFSPDGLRVVTGGWEKAAKIWDAFTGQPLAEPLQTPTGSGYGYWGEFRPDGRCVVTASSDGTARIWEVPLAPVPVPVWLSELAEAVAGQRFNAQRMPERVKPEEFLKLKQRLAESSGTSFYERWARWYFADRSTRTLSPSSSMTVPQHVQRCIRDDTLASLQEAALLAPTNEVALARLARRLLAEDPAQNPHAHAQAGEFSYRAVELAPSDPEALWARAEVLERMTNSQAAARTEFLKRGVHGVAKLLAAAETMRHSSWFGPLPMPLCRQSNGLSRIVWQTAPVSLAAFVDQSTGRTNAYVHFRLAAATGWISQPQGKFTLKLNGQPLLDFDVTLQSATWHSPDGNARVIYTVMEANSEDSSGLLEIEVAASLLKADQPAEFEVAGSASNSQRWFGIYLVGQ